MNEYIKSKWTYALIVLTVFAMIIWIVAGTSHDNKQNNIMVNQETYTMETSVKENTTQVSETVSGYYVARAEGERVLVYWVDGSGEHLHRETTIAYPLLSLEDQEMLDEGIILESDEKLPSFLENYDS